MIFDNQIGVNELLGGLDCPGVYVIYSVGSGRRYIGQSNNIILRIANHFRKLEAGDHHNRFVQQDFNKYGKSSFVISVLEKMPHATREELLTKEKFHINDNYGRHLLNIMSTS